MENVISQEEFKLSHYYNLIDDKKHSEGVLEVFTNKKSFSSDLSVDDISSSNDSFVFSKDSFTQSKDINDSSFEDSNTFLKKLFKGKETLLNENWQKNETIQGKIINLNKNEVFVDCLIDLENKIFQNRTFPIYLFESLTNLKADKPVLIKTRLKPGSVRMDVYPGDGIVNLDLFTNEENWDSLRGKNLDSKLTEW